MRKHLQLWLSRPEVGALFMLVVMMLIFESIPRFSEGLSWGFINQANLQNLLSILPELGLITMGVTLLLIVREFDLSVGSVSAIAGVMCFELMSPGERMLNLGLGPGLAIALSLMLCMVIGLVNGYITVHFKIHSFIATLGMLFIVRSLAVVVTDGFPPATPDHAPLGFSQTAVLGLTLPLWLFAAVALGVVLLLAKTNWGNWMYAVGGDEKSSHCVGVNIILVKLIGFVLCSLLAGLSGILVALRMATATPSAGDGLELEALAATVIGGASLQGGIGTAIGAIIGTAIIRLIDVGLIVARVDSNWFKFAVGAMLIFAVIFNAQIRNMARKIKIDNPAARSAPIARDGKASGDQA